MPTNPASRRRFLQQLGATSLAAALPAPLFAAQPPTNPTPLAAGAFSPLPLGRVKPTGWLLAQLRIQASGLSGHLDEIWPDVGPASGWLGGSGESWERGPYFLDGLVPLAYLLDDARLKAKAQRYIDWTLASQQPNGFFGPASNNDWWPRIVMLKVLTQYHEATADPRVLPFMGRYFAHQLAELPNRPLRDWGKFRWQDNALTVLWLYNRTGDSNLLALVRLLHSQGHDWVAQYDNFQYTQRITAEYLKLDQDQGLKDLALSTHGVNNGQAIKTGPVWSLVSGSASDRAAAQKMLSTLDHYHGLPNGMFSCDEHLAGLNPSQGSELCTVVEEMFSLEQSLAITGDPALGDRLEKLAFNALPGTLTDDMWAHQYNQEPNQVECSLHHAPWTTDGPESGLFGLEPNFGCCTANFHQGWPKFAASLWMATPDDGLAAVAYAPCVLETTLLGTAVRITQQTNYPFHGAIRITVNPASPLAFPLSLRIPAWASGATVTINGQPQPSPSTGTFARLARTWQPGDLVELTLPLQPRISRGFQASAAIERGPLVFSFPIGEDWLKLRDRGTAPSPSADWQIYPTTPWNYALVLNPDTPDSTITTTLADPGPIPFAAHGTAVTLHLKARKVPAWRAIDGVAEPVPQSPVTSTEPEETIALIPYAAAKLRITAFPVLKNA